VNLVELSGTEKVNTLIGKTKLINLKQAVRTKILQTCAEARMNLRSSFFFCGSTVLLDPGRFKYRSFLELFKHMVGLLGRVISPSQGLYLRRTTQHRKTRTNIHALSGIRTHDPSTQPAKTHASDRTATVTDI
jgi:hypothetical protein